MVFPHLENLETWEGTFHDLENLEQIGIFWAKKYQYIDMTISNSTYWTHQKQTHV
jgi:hypothetical protein